MRLDQYIAKATGRTRKESRKVIRSGEVTVDATMERNAGRHITPGVERITVGDHTIDLKGATGHLTLVLNKPLGVICATRDDRERTVFDLPALWNHHRRDELRCVGRLDKDTTGLLLLTTDGTLVHRLTHPKRGVVKRYVVSYLGDLAEDAPSRVAAGLQLEDGTLCRPARLELRAPGECVVEVHEGKYHQVRRMISACGGHVTALERVSIGSLRLAEDHERGQIRPLETKAKFLE